VNDYVTLKSGYWWKWHNETNRVLYKNFISTLINATFRPVVRTNASGGNDSVIEYHYTLPRPHKCPREKSCLGGLESSCAVGYEGPLCEVCSARYYKQLKLCKECPTKKWMAGQLSILVTVVVIVIVVVVWTRKRKSKKSEERSLVDIILGRLKIVIGFYQVTSGILEAFSYIKWPDSLALIGKYSEILQLNFLQIAPVHCLFPTLEVNAFGALFAMLSLNAAAIIVAMVAYQLRKFLLMGNTSPKEQKLKKLSQTKALIYRNLFFFLYITYLSTCLKTANVLPLACRTLCIDENEENCGEFLRADYNVQCTSPEFNRSVIVAFFAVAYILLLPTATLITLWKQRNTIRNSGEADENETPRPQEQSKEVFSGLRFLFENYNAHSWYWELVETLRKVVLTSCLILVGGESRAYVGFACVISSLYAVVFAYKKPIVDPFENKLMLSSLIVTFINLGIGVVSRIPKEGIPSSIDPYLDNVLFKALVFGANSLVIGVFMGEH